MKKKLLKFILILSFITFVPIFAFAQAATSSSLTDVISKINDLFKALLPILVSLGVIYFIWGMVQYFIADGEEAKKTGRDRILYGIIGLAVIVSIWGLVAILSATLGIGQNAAPDVTKLISTPASSSACSLSGNNLKLSDYLNYVTCTINGSVIPFIFALAIVMFIWGAVKFFIINADEEAKRAQGKQYMLWGIIALTVMLSVWGLVTILKTTFGIDTGASVLPQVAPPPKN